jgi:ATP-dependent Lon protease
LVLPIGGVKEKTLAAARAGIRTVILPKRNERDMEEVDALVRKKLKFVLVERVEEVLDYALGHDRIERAMHKRKSDIGASA